MAKDRENMGGPTQSPKDEPTDDRDNRNPESRDDVPSRSMKGDKPGRGERNGSDKVPRG